METKISYYEYREHGGTQVDITASLRTTKELEDALFELRGKQVAAPPGSQPGKPPEEPPPTTRQPYFDIGDGQGRAGDIVRIPVFGGCRLRINGFHIGGGVGKTDEDRSGYGKFEAVGADLGIFLLDYLTANNLQQSYWADFEMVKHEPHGALPEEWWQYAMAFFSIDQAKAPLPPIQIPVDTLLLTLRIKILDGTPPGDYELTCKDEHHYSREKRRRKDWLYTTDTDSPLASGGVTQVDLQGGKLTVIA